MKRATLRSFLALVAFFGLRCAPVIAQTQTAVFTYYVTVPLTLGSCVGSNPIFSTASLYCGTGTVTATYEPSCMNISPTNVTFAGANYAIPNTSSPVIYESSLGPVGGLMQPVVWTGSSGSVSFYVSALQNIGTVGVVVTCY